MFFTAPGNAGNNALALDIDNTSEEIKRLILENRIGLPSVPKDFQEKNILGQDSDLGKEVSGDGKGVQLFSYLKETIRRYNSTQSQNEEDKIPMDIFQADKVGLYNNYAVLNYIVQLQ